jgi:hypothetical protein
VACADGVDQGLEFGRRGCVAPGSPAALEGGPGIEPGPDGSDCLRPVGLLASWGRWGPAGPPLSWTRRPGGRRVRGDEGGLPLRRLGEAGVPAERERAGDQGLVAADRGVGADLEVGPAEFVLDLFVALLDPVPDAVDPHDLGQVGRGSGLSASRGDPGRGRSVAGYQVDCEAGWWGRWWPRPGARSRRAPRSRGWRRRPTRSRCARRGSSVRRGSSPRDSRGPSRSGRGRRGGECRRPCRRPSCRGSA